MSNNSDKEDPLARACALVGRFQYHFARVEQKVDEAVVKLLDLDEKGARIVTGGVDFAKKLNVVRAYAFEQAANDEDKKFGEKTCNDVFGVNTTRQDVIHSSFEPASRGGVQFKRTVSTGGRVRVYDQIWPDVQFYACYEQMRALEEDLNRLILLIKPLPPMGWASPFWDVPRRPTSTAHFAPASTWVPRPPPGSS